MKIRSIFLGICIVALLFSVGANASTIELGTITYPGECVNTLPGNISLVFKSSDNNNITDVVILNSDYLPSNYTFLRFGCYNVSKGPYEWSFINNTKAYYYFDANVPASNDTYRIWVNYSSIKVPAPPWESEMKTLNNTIVNLTERVTNLTINNSELSSLLTSYSNQLNSLRVEHNSLSELYTAYRTSTESIVMSYYTLINESLNKSYEISRLDASIRGLESDIDDWEATYSSLSDAWSTGYTKDGEDYFYFNGAWFLIGGLVFVIIIIVLYFIKSGKIPIKRKRKEEKVVLDKKVAVYEEIPDVEKTILNPVESRAEIDDEALSKSRRGVSAQDEESTEKKVIKEKMKTSSWWNSPEGLARKQELKRQMEEVNRKRRENKDEV